MDKGTKVKHVVFACLLVVFCAGAVEFSVLLAYRLTRGQAFPRAWFREQISHTASRIGPARPARTDAADGVVQEGVGIEVLHPYLGYVRDPQRNDFTSAFGFPGNGGPAVQAPSNALKVAVFGGSFAEGVFWRGGPVLRDSLAVVGRPVKLVNFAMGGYKQPQQLLCLVYMLSQGARFDVVLNIDGFNEIVLPAVDNAPSGVTLAYPRAWGARVAGFRERDVLMKLAKVTALDERRRSWAQLFERTGMYRSAALCLVWRARDRQAARRRNTLAAGIEQARRKSHNRFLTTGPAVHRFDEPIDLYRHLASQWREASLRMQAVCEAHDMIYVHALQPNQYVPGSKPMGDEERAVAVKPDHKYRPSVEQGYPWLIKAGETLERNGVNFVDLTLLFADVDEMLYKDDCCHVNDQGYALVAAAVANRVLPALTAPADKTRQEEAAESGGP